MRCKIALLEEANLPQKESFRHMMSFSMICALSCFDKSASKLDSLFMSNEERGGAQKKKKKNIAFLLRHNPDERD